MDKLQQIPVVSLYQQHQPWLHAWACRKTGCPYQAEDVIQDTFIRVLKKSGQCLQCQEPRAYLLTIAKGLIIDKWRRQEIERAYLEALAQFPENEAPSAENLNEILETLLLIDQALETLPEKARKAFIMAQFDGMKYREIAEVLEVSERTIKKYIAQAMLVCVMACE
jgi:RNA polymerase sigma-70 factor (ECF subfamily)